MNQVSSDRMNVSRLVWQHRKMSPVKHNNLMTTLNGGSLGSCIDEERSQLRYVMWIAEFSESSNLWTQIALSGTPGSMSAWVSFKPILDHVFIHGWVGGEALCPFLKDGALLKIATRRRTLPIYLGYAARLAYIPADLSAVLVWYFGTCFWFLNTRSWK